MNVKTKVYTAAAGLMMACMAAASAHAQLYSGGNIAVAPQAGLNQTDVFTFDTNGTLNVFWAGTGGWRGPEKVGPDTFIIGGSLAASQQFGLTQTDVFAIDQYGQLNVFWVAGGGAWQGPEKIGPSGLFLPGASLAVSQQFGLNQTDVFSVDKNGQLEVFWVGGGGAWQGPQKIGAPVFEAGSYGYLTAGRQVGLNQTDVFLVNASGQLEVFWVDGGGAWQGPKAIGTPGLAEAQYAPMAVHQQIGLNQTDLFLVDRSGQLNVFWAVGGGAWAGPEKIGASESLSSFGFITASQQFGLNQTDVFAVDNNDQLEVFWVDGGGAWGGPETIGPAGLALEPGSPIAVGQQVGLNQTDLFMIDSGNLELSWVDNGGAWKGPKAIY